MEHTGTQRVFPVDAVEITPSLILLHLFFRETQLCISRASHDLSVVTYPVRIAITFCL
jgi:hypothetical protein